MSTCIPMWSTILPWAPFSKSLSVNLTRLLTRIPGSTLPVSYTHLDVYKRQVVTCIGKNGERVLSEMFICFMLHYRFHAEFCNIGKGNEKGAVENKVGYSRRNWYVPFLQTTGFEELTAEIYKEALEDLERPHYKKGVLISELWAEEKTNLLPLPAEPFEPVEFQTVKVLSLIHI